MFLEFFFLILRVILKNKNQIDYMVIDFEIIIKNNFLKLKKS